MPGEGRGAPNPCVCPPLAVCICPVIPSPPLITLWAWCLSSLSPSPSRSPFPGQAVSATAPRGAPHAPGMLWKGLSVPRDGVKGWEPGRSWAKLLEKLHGGSSHLPRVGFLRPQSRHGRGTGSPLLHHPKRWGSSISPLEGHILPCHGTTQLSFSFWA